jgi:hypothetical protein
MSFVVRAWLAAVFVPAGTPGCLLAVSSWVLGVTTSCRSSLKIRGFFFAIRRRPAHIFFFYCRSLHKCRQALALAAPILIEVPFELALHLNRRSLNQSNTGKYTNRGSSRCSSGLNWEPFPSTRSSTS